MLHWLVTFYDLQILQFLIYSPQFNRRPFHLCILLTFLPFIRTYYGRRVIFLSSRYSTTKPQVIWFLEHRYLSLQAIGKPNIGESYPPTTSTQAIFRCFGYAMMISCVILPLIWFLFKPARCEHITSDDIQRHILGSLVDSYGAEVVALYFDMHFLCRTSINLLSLKTFHILLELSHFF